MKIGVLRPLFARLEHVRLYAEEKAQTSSSPLFWKIVALAVAALAVLGMPLFAVMGSVAIVLWWSHDDPTQQYARFIAPTVLDDRFAASPLLITIPLFTFAGYLMAESKTPLRLVRASSAALGWMPGGLAVVCIAASAFFTTMTGGSGVTIVAVGGFLYPALVKQGYPKDFSLGLVTSAGAIGLLFPPSPLVMIYSVVAGVDMNSAYLATGIPALGLMIVLATYAVYVGVKRGVPRSNFDFGELVVATWGVKWELLAPFLVAFGILTGLMQLDEAAAFAALYFLIVEVYIYRDLNWKQVLKISKDAIVLAGSLIIILMMATAMSNYIISENVSTKILTWFIDALNVSKLHPELEQWKFILALNVFLFIVGMLMDGFSTILVGLPLLLPLAAAFGIHPFHLAVMFLLNMELAYIMPPAGLNLFISSFRFNRPVAQVYRVVIPYVVLLHIGLIALIVFPKLSTFSVSSKANKARAEAAAHDPPLAPREAWLIECVQLDRSHPRPCNPTDKDLWGEDGDHPKSATPEPVGSDDVVASEPTSDKPVDKNAPDVKNFNKDQKDLLDLMMGGDSSAKPKASAAP
jgi:C4-dicarboxylate transporter DctM subunit